MNKSKPLAIDLLQLLGPAFTEARQLQIPRMKKAFADGWRVPEDICKSYRAWYASHIKIKLSEDRMDDYSRMCDQFCQEIERSIGFPPEWSRLDPLTLFGEICTGERMGDGTLVSTTRETRH